jgi:FkbM family methyltransferase
MQETLTTLFGNHMVDLTVLNSGCIIIDAGASTGAFIRDIKEKLANPIIYAIEPSSGNMNNLMEINGLVLINAALVGKGRPEYMTFYEKTGLPEWGSVNTIHKSRKGREYPVPTITIDRILSIIHDGHIDYLKMDIEGSEQEVILDLTPETAKRIHQISMELHNVSVKAMTSKLESLGYETTFKTGELYGRQRIIPH